MSNTIQIQYFTNKYHQRVILNITTIVKTIYKPLFLLVLASDAWLSYHQIQRAGNPAPKMWDRLQATHPGHLEWQLSCWTLRNCGRHCWSCYFFWKYSFSWISRYTNRVADMLAKQALLSETDVRNTPNVGN